MIQGERLAEPNPTPQNAGNPFLGWYSDSQKTFLYNFNLTVNNNLTLYGKWRDSITINLYEESTATTPYETYTIAQGTKFSELIDDPTKENYTFDGWYKDSIVWMFLLLLLLKIIMNLRDGMANLILLEQR